MSALARVLGTRFWDSWAKNESEEPSPAPVSGVRGECRDSVRGTVPTVRTARAVWSFDRRMHSRWSQSYLLSRKHTPFILQCATNCNTLKYWSPRGDCANSVGLRCSSVAEFASRFRSSLEFTMMRWLLY